MNDNKSNTDAEHVMRNKAVMVLNALQRLVVVAKYIDIAFAKGDIAQSDHERMVFVRNSLCITANIWNDHLSGSINKLYRGKMMDQIKLDESQITFYKERMPRSVRYAANELKELNIHRTSPFIQSAEEIVEAMSLYAQDAPAIAMYLKDHQEDIEDIPMLEMMEDSGAKLRRADIMDINAATA